MMYIPNTFKISDQEALNFIQANAFGQLISRHNGRTVSSHLPFLIDKNKKLLSCHLAKINPQWQDLEQQEVLISFLGPHDYISPSWYQAGGVPTWNYQAVHVYGQVKIIQNTEQLQQMVNQLSHIYESGFKQPWQPDYNPAMLKAIVGVEIAITEIQGKYKLSQNKSLQDQQNIAKQLKLKNSALAKSMTSQPG
ncbi:MAG: FMN-binding negative transcriptional regulator [Enterobacterales bacterium]|nr:FMN-binding negative transcriptional regulator [Enterobacterales bacterium]